MCSAPFATAFFAMQQEPSRATYCRNSVMLVAVEQKLPKKSRLSGGMSPGRKRPTGGGVSGVPSHYTLVMIWFGQNSKLIIN
jgi:hypothetical protein